MGSLCGSSWGEAEVRGAARTPADLQRLDAIPEVQPTPLAATLRCTNTMLRCTRPWAQIMVRGKPITVDLSSAYKRPTPEEEERRKRRNREREERRKRQRDHVKQLVSNMNRGIPTFDPLLGRGAKKVARGRKAGGTMGMGSWPDYDDFHISDEKAEKWERMLEEETAEEDPSLAAREEQ